MRVDRHQDRHAGGNVEALDPRVRHRLAAHERHRREESHRLLDDLLHEDELLDMARFHGRIAGDVAELRLRASPATAGERESR